MAFLRTSPRFAVYYRYPVEMLVLPIGSRCSDQEDAFRDQSGEETVVTDTDTDLADFDWPMQYETVYCPGAKAATTATTTPACPARVSSAFKPDSPSMDLLDHEHSGPRTLVIEARGPFQRILSGRIACRLPLINVSLILPVGAGKQEPIYLGGKAVLDNIQQVNGACRLPYPSNTIVNLGSAFRGF